MKSKIKKFYTDIWGVVFILIGLFTAFSLGSYSSQDPALVSWSVGKSVNYCGFIGSFYADVLLQLFGIMSWFLVVYFIMNGVRGFRGSLLSKGDFKIISALVTIFILSALIELHWSKGLIASGQLKASGYFGYFITKGFISVLNPLGTGLILWSMLLLHFVFMFEISIKQIFQFISLTFRVLAKNLKEWSTPSKKAPKYSQPLFLNIEKEEKKNKSKITDSEKDSLALGLFKKLETKTIDFIQSGKSLKSNSLVIDEKNKINLDDEKDFNQEKLDNKVINIKNGIKSLITKKNKKEENNFELDEKNKLFDEDEDKNENSNDSKELTIVAASENIDSVISKNGKRQVVAKGNIPAKIENWKMPKLNLLEDPPATRAKVDKEELRNKAELLTEKLKLFNVEGIVTAVKSGPAVTMLEFKPNADVKLSTITSLENDLAIALSSESLRIIAPIPGRDVVGIESSNSVRETVYLKDLIAEENFWKDDFKLPIAVGKQTNGDPQIVDLRKMPHLLVAGSTGSGKSVFTVSTITGLIFKHSPKTLKLILIDPKQVDLAAFTQIPHLLMPPITDTTKAVNALRWAVKEMDKRYRSMSKFGARGLESYNESIQKLSAEEVELHANTNTELESQNKRNKMYYFKELPYIVVVVEEFGDLMQIDSDNVEGCVVRLAQLARACGIHLILCMQSPRKEVVTGLIKTNIPGRISFKVASKMDSRIILDESGAERLLARGDMLFRAPGTDKPIRYHGPWLTDPEINHVAKFWSDQSEPVYDPKILELFEAKDSDDEGGYSGASSSFDRDENNNEYDEMYDEILDYVSQLKEVSASLLQRKYRFGYPRAARLIETMEREKVVGPANGSKPRQVLIQSYAATK